MFLSDIEDNKLLLTEKIKDKSVLVIGGAGSIGSSFIKAILPFEPKSLVVVDINENGLAELTRDLFQVIFIDIKCKILELLGKASYNIFLVQMAYFCVSDTIYELVPNRVLQLIINVLVCCTLGLAFYYVENPVTSAVIKCINRKS